MKISFITTILNEEKTIDIFLDSLFSQSKLLDEVIIVDGGSSDQTVAKIKNAKLKVKNYNSKLKILIKKGNRAVGRNEGIRQARGNIILSADAGCILDKDWTKNIIKPFADPAVDVVAGYYKGKPETVFQKCLIPYVLVMPDRVDPENFLPASRTMAFRKTIWEKAGKFPEQFSHNEDYVFAQTLRKMKAKIVFQNDAIVYWLPRKTWGEAFYMFYRFAFGDAEAGIWRAKVVLLFVRYLFGIFLLLSFFVFKLYFILHTLYLILFIYALWSIKKNYRYINHVQAIVYLPLLQYTSDFAILLGSSLAVAKHISYLNKII